MFICNNRRCQTVFDEDELRIVRECVGEYWGTPAYQEYGTCPCCKSDDYSEAEQCEECGEYFNEREVSMYDSMNICDRCYEELYEEETA